MKVTSVVFLGFILLLGCSTAQKDVVFTINNPVQYSRNEVVEIPLEELNLKLVDYEGFPVVYCEESSDPVLCQLADANSDNSDDLLLIWAELEAGQKKTYKITFEETKPEFDSKVFSRFVPERTDDYAWENNRVAFRTFGPTAQRMFEGGDPAGTLSSGIDCWLKKVDYPVINKWYEKATSGKGTYHKDTGEGLDNFHVGGSRGCGGIGVYKENILYVSKNYTHWETISNGPLRTEFILNYEDWMAGDIKIHEMKKISLDLGNNLSKVEVMVEGAETISAGLTFHENDGEVSVDKEKRWFSYYQPHGDSYLGTGIVCEDKYFSGYKPVISEEADQSQLLVHLKVTEGKAIYYTGFGWKKSGQFESESDWETYLDRFAKNLANPLIVKVSSN